MVNLLDIFPLTFEEFLEATDAPLFTYYEDIHKEQQIEEIFHNRLLEAYNNYLIIGGMPECVSSWLKQMAGIDNSAILLKSTYQFKGPETNCQGLFNQIHKKSTKKVPEALYGS